MKRQQALEARPKPEKWHRSTSEARKNDIEAWRKQGEKYNFAVKNSERTIKNHMTALRYLNQIATLETKTKRDRERLEELRATSGISSLRYGCKVQTSPRTDILGDRAANVIDLERKYVDDVVELETAKCKTLSIIHTLDDEPCEQLLYLRYIRQLNFYEISDSMSFSLSYLHRLHSKALQMFQKRLENLKKPTFENVSKS